MINRIPSAEATYWSRTFFNPIFTVTVQIITLFEMQKLDRNL